MTTADLERVAAAVEGLPDVLEALLAPYDHVTLTTAPAEGEWSVHQVVEHLITGDGPAFRSRISGIVAGDERICSFDPADAMHSRDSNALELSVLLGDLRVERAQSAALIRSLDPDDLSRTSMHSQGEFAAGDFVNEWPFHDHDHLQQIHEILKAHHAVSMTATMRRALELD